MRVVVMGVSGSGKSTLGVALAERLACPFVEGDDLHSADAVAKMRAGQPLTDADRWPWLDRVGRALAAHETIVASCSALRRAYRERLAAVAGGEVRFVLLDGAPDVLARRLRTRTGHYMPASLLDSQLATLERPGADEPALTLSPEQPIAVLVERTLAWLRSQG